MIKEVKTVGAMVGIDFCRRFERQIGDDAANAYGLPFWGDQPITEAESSETTNIRNMTFRPVGSYPNAWRFESFKIGRVHRSNGFETFLS